MLNVGLHVSIAGKIYDSIDRAVSLGCSTMQIFSRNPRQWRKKILEDKDIKLFKEKREKAKIKPLVVHVPYLLNLASQKKSFHQATIKEFIKDLVESDRLGADFLVTHMGSHKNGTEQSGLSSVVEALTCILEESEDVKTKILLENTAGSGSWLGYNFSHFSFIFERINNPSRVQICLDTAHAWAAGYKISQKKGLSQLISEIDTEVGVSKLKLIHLNDTEVELGSRLDRHFHIGRGKIGEDGFRLILNHPKLRQLPFIMETPKKVKDDDRKNLEMAKNLFNDGVYKRN